MPVTLVTLSGRFSNPDSTPALAGGRITFELVPADIPDTSIPETVVPGPVSAPVIAGTFTVALPRHRRPRTDRIRRRAARLPRHPHRDPRGVDHLTPVPRPVGLDRPVAATGRTRHRRRPRPRPTRTPGPPGVAGGATTVAVFTYTDEADTRPDSDVVFWIPDPFDLPNPIGAEVGDLVLRSTPDVITGATGTTAIWTGTAAEYEALASYDDTTIYFIVP